MFFLPFYTQLIAYALFWPQKYTYLEGKIGSFLTFMQKSTFFSQKLNNLNIHLSLYSTLGIHLCLPIQKTVLNNDIWAHFHIVRSGWIWFSSVDNGGDENANSAEAEDPHKSRPENCPVVVSDPSIFGSRPPWRPLPRVVIHERGQNLH